MDVKEQEELSREDLLSAAELARLFDMSRATLYRHLRGGPPPVRKGKTTADLRQIPDTYIGGRRYWYRKLAQRCLSKALGLE